NDTDPVVLTVTPAPAICGEPSAAEAHARRLESLPGSGGTRIGGILLPLHRALVALRHDDSTAALTALAPAPDFAMGSIARFWPTYVEGLIHLERGAAAEACAAFDRIIARRSVAPTDPIYPLAHLG